MGLSLAMAASWGFAEATLFFIVADVWLSVVAVRHGARAALAASLAATAGAVAGGALMYAWGATDPAGAASVLEAVPAISPAMLDQVRAALHEQGATALFAGTFTGIPYKLYAALAPDTGVGPLTFLATTVPARLARFVPASLLTALLARMLFHRQGLRHRLAVLIGFWFCFYGLYFRAMAG